MNLGKQVLSYVCKKKKMDREFCESASRECMHNSGA